MIALWVLYSIAFTFALSLAAVLLERALRWAGRSARFVWLVALVWSFAFPFWSALTRTPTPPVRESTGTARAGLQSVLSTAGSLLDRPLLLAWVALSTTLVIALALAQRALLHQRGHWQERRVADTDVLVSSNLGPGVWALGRARIVIPQWCLALRPHESALLIAHEREHLRARDHWLLLTGLFALVICPINVGLWWQFRRLKLAIEMDCDARVLSGRQDVRGYATLLLDVGQRCRTGHLALAAFAAPPHAIERRIRMMLDPKPRSHRLLAGACAVCAVVIGVLACSTPEPAAPDVAVRNALGLQKFEEPHVVDLSREANEVHYRTVEDKKAANDDVLPPPPPPPPRPGERATITIRDRNGTLRTNEFIKGPEPNAEFENKGYAYKKPGVPAGEPTQVRGVLLLKQKQQ